jgi:hypothetical protein
MAIKIELTEEEIEFLVDMCAHCKRLQEILEGRNFLKSGVPDIAIIDSLLGKLGKK